MPIPVRVFRARVHGWTPDARRDPERDSEQHGFVAQMVDNGYAFEGPHWRYGDSSLQGLYFRPVVYQEVRGLDAFQPWLDRIIHFPEELIDQVVKQIPPAWLEDDEKE